MKSLIYFPFHFFFLFPISLFPFKTTGNFHCRLFYYSSVFFFFKISFPAITDAAAARTIIIGAAVESPVTGFFPDSSEPPADGVLSFLFSSFFTKSLAAFASFSVAALISSAVASSSSSTVLAFVSASLYTFQLSAV